MELDEILTKAVKLGASDIHLKVASKPKVRIKTILQTLDEYNPITVEDMTNFISKILAKSENKKAELIKNGEVDISYSIPTVSRFRVNIYRQRGTYAIALRALKTNIPRFEELLLPEVIRKIAEEARGLVLVTGPTGSGKSTTLASMLDYRNEIFEETIITIEDPIEYVFRDKKAYIVQREVDLDTRDFSTGLRAALREDPDVIMVGEMRDLETIQTALRAAETGHFVLSTLHTQDAKDTISRIINMFPGEEQNHLRILLAAVLKAVISQRLIPRKDGKGVVPAVEVLINTGAITECIMDPDKLLLINDYMEKGKKMYGMQTFDQAVVDLYNQGLISYEDALMHASNPSDVELKIKGITAGEDEGLDFGGFTY
ncbi:MAG TPA: type IV pilus twitching motility protein PilT [Sulfurihydrogenibium sp.]|uniref:PilT/PilU family type 4a pilus ATPase n=1 Tax=Sulfurihydrogenibium sp. (strain YO3AOP1) TaxID=436114 RepID=UPI00017266CA|nr:type IV pilus twitching motility protein PilT [Sulfurihydrogenibium sp. YO3AOP1]ACD66006.1 twitching motility protein [Sulfurihydrogenibium sp. YO3AOP1]HBT98648.1 type IV pilus twitching motility protein PilT [Sulfurihydrogenibium sp.]